MASQTGNNALMAFKVQSGLGSASSGAGATGLRVKPGQGLKLNKTRIASEELRRDGGTTKDRHGMRSAGASYSGELSTGTFDALLEAITRGTWVAAATVTAASHTSITVTTTTIVALAGSFITDGIRVGDKIKLASSHTGTNDAKWYRVVGVTASTLTLGKVLVAGALVNPLVLDATADAAAVITVAKTVIWGASPTERYFTLEDYGQDIDAGELGTDMKLCKLSINAQPGKNVEITMTWMGLDVQPISGASAPNFTSPTYTTTVPLVMQDGTMRIGGVDYTILSGFQLDIDLGGNVPQVNAPKGPDVFLDNAKVSGTFSAIRQDLTFLTAFSAETLVDFFLDFVVGNMSDPKDFLSCYVGNAVLNDNTKALSASGPMIETVPWGAGKDEVGGSHANTMVKFATSAP